MTHELKIEYQDKPGKLTTCRAACTCGWKSFLWRTVGEGATNSIHEIHDRHVAASARVVAR